MGRETGGSLFALAGDVLDKSEELARQQVELLKAELRQEARRAAAAGACIGAGGGLVAAAGLLSTLAAVHWLHRTTRLPLWGCYGLVAGALGAAGSGLLTAGRANAAGVRFPPPETTEALRENWQWLKKQLAEAAGK